jgi:hypothetical protein
MFGLPHPTNPFLVGMVFEFFHHLLCANCIKSAARIRLLRLSIALQKKPNRLRMGLCALRFPVLSPF